MTSSSQEMRDFVLSLTSHRDIAKSAPDPLRPSERVLNLARQLAAWHDTRPVPDRWHPLLLGRVAARFGASRELAAAALIHAGWNENRISAGSWWTAPASPSSTPKE